MRSFCDEFGVQEGLIRKVTGERPLRPEDRNFVRICMMEENDLFLETRQYHENVMQHSFSVSGRRVA